MASKNKLAVSGYKTIEEQPLLFLIRVRGLYADVCEELDHTDQENDAYCLLLSNLADDLAGFISGIDLLREARL